MRVPPLTRKLLRDLLDMKGQALAIAMVVAAGVAMAVMYLSNFDSLRRTQQAYYERQRFGDVFASLKRAPLRLRDDIAAFPGVTAVETRVVASVTLDVPGMDEPATGHLVSIPEDRRPQVNDVFLRGGRWVEPTRPDEVLASEAFVQAHGFTTGSRVRAVLNGRLRELTIVGIALSPEHVYNIPPGELVPDDRRYGVFWMGERALAAAFDMEGGFNDVSLLLAPTASTGDVMARLDGLLEPYGGLGAIPRALQISHWTLENELAQLQSFGFIVPMIFLMVAAFVLNVALARALALQRPQIAALKALGYGNGAIAWHYLQWAMLIALAGVAIGIAGGWWLGSALIGLYNQYFHFPILLYRMSGGVLVGVTVLTILSAVLGAASAVRRAVRIPPAEAMRPEPPAVYRRSLIETPLLAPHFGTTGRMVLRNITRQPLRAGASVLGISMAVAVLMVGFVFIDAMDALITTQFSVAERQDVTVAFVEPRSASSRHALARLPGVLAVEPIRTVPVRLRARHRHRTLALTGARPGARLRRIVDMDGRTIAVPASGLLLSSRLGQVLDVAPGDDVTVEVLEGARPIRSVRVSALVDDTFGLSAYMDLDALHDLMREGDVLSGAALLVDVADTALPGRLKETPAVAGATFKATVLRSFRETMAANLNLTMFLNVIFAGVIAFGVVYNAARVSLSERSRELASLRVLGFTRAEISLILLGELALLTLASLPVGAVVGYGFAAAIVGSLDSEVYRFPLVVGRQSVAWAWLAIMGAALASGLIVRRQLDGLDLVAVLKVRE